MHASSMVALRHLLVNNAAACGHPLHIASANHPAVTHAIAVRHGSRKHVGDGLDSTVRMPWESRQIVLWNIIAEIVEQQKGIEVLGASEAKCPAEMHSCTFESWFGLNEPLYRSNRHVKTPIKGEYTVVMHLWAKSLGHYASSACGSRGS